VAAGLFDFLRFHVTAGIGDVDGAAEERGDADAGAAAGDLDFDVRGEFLVFFGPGLGEVDEGIGAFILN
jgi:hypothetical protein